MPTTTTSSRPQQTRFQAIRLIPTAQSATIQTTTQQGSFPRMNPTPK